MMQQIENVAALNTIIDKRLNNGSRLPFINQFRDEFEARKQQDLAKANASIPRTAKLSTLQKQILSIAWHWRSKARSDIYTNDIKVEAFGWQPLSHYWNGWTDEGLAAPGTARYAQDRHLADDPIYGHIFDRQSIGCKHYNAVSVSVSRALKRLTERHLLYQSGRGWSLTEHGAEVAKPVSAPMTQIGG